MVSRSSDLETRKLIGVIKEFSIFINLLADGMIPHVERGVAGSAPATIAGGKGPAPHREVSAEDAVFGSNKPPARVVQAQSAVFAPIVPCVFQTWVPRCETAGKNKLEGVQNVS
jgi:hypothetical protein